MQRIHNSPSRSLAMMLSMLSISPISDMFESRCGIDGTRGREILCDESWRRRRKKWCENISAKFHNLSAAFWLHFTVCACNGDSHWRWRCLRLVIWTFSAWKLMKKTSSSENRENSMRAYWQCTRVGPVRSDPCKLWVLYSDEHCSLHCDRDNNKVNVSVWITIEYHIN